MGRPFDLITFDFDGVLLHNNFHDLFFGHCRELGLCWPEPCESKLARYIHEYYASGNAAEDLKAHGSDAFWLVANRRFLEVLEVEGEIDEVLEQLVERVRGTEATYFYETGLHDLLTELRGRGYRIAMLTNRDERIQEFGAEWGLIEPFEFIGTRETVGKPKPEPDVFRHINEWFDIPPLRSLHVGDNPFADARGAHAAGWECVLIDPDDIFPDWDIPRLRSIHELPGWLDQIAMEKD